MTATRMRRSHGTLTQQDVTGELQEALSHLPMRRCGSMVDCTGMLLVDLFGALDVANPGRQQPSTSHPRQTHIVTTGPKSPWLLYGPCWPAGQRPPWSCMPSMPSPPRST